MKKVLNNIDLAWIAGFWEGEGSCNCYHFSRGKYTWYRLISQISQKDKEPLQFILKVFNFGSLGRWRASSFTKKYQWKYAVTSRKARKFLTILLPFIKTKRRINQIKHALKLDKEKVDWKYAFAHGR